MFKALVGSRLPEKYQKYFDLPIRYDTTRISDTDDTALGRACLAWMQEHGVESGVYRLDFGLDALAARLGLIHRAERCIDIQSYLIRDDLSGNLVALALIEAANRGVRVRLLMDDALTEPIDAGLMAINDHPNIEVRVFNPFPRRRSRLISFIANFNILNRRMHNKSFTVDGQVTIVGGRNLADEYFRTGGDHEFMDEDLLAIGRVVESVAAGFDEYWNTREAIPVSVFDSVVDRLSISQTVSAGHRYLADHRDSPYLREVDNTLIDDLLAGRLPLIAAEVDLVMDRPEKVTNVVSRRTGRTAKYLRKLVSGADQELIIVSPYFVPQRQGVEFFAALVRKAVRVVVVTNSLASTNHSSVHAAYAWYRKPLLQQGIELYELAADRGVGAAGSTRLTLHSKVAIMDRRKTFVGSFNLDPRSLYLNTEMGLVVASEVLGASIAESILDSLPDLAYRLCLSSSGSLRWVRGVGSDERRFTAEPDTNLMRRLATKMMGFLPIEGQM